MKQSDNKMYILKEHEHIEYSFMEKCSHLHLSYPTFHKTAQIDFSPNLCILHCRSNCSTSKLALIPKGP